MKLSYIFLAAVLASEATALLGMGSKGGSFSFSSLASVTDFDSFQSTTSGMRTSSSAGSATTIYNTPNLQTERTSKRLSRRTGVLRW